MNRWMALQQAARQAAGALCVMAGMGCQSVVADDQPPLQGILISRGQGELGKTPSLKALSSDARWVALATTDPPTLWLLDAQNQVQRRYPSRDSRAKNPSQISGIWTNPSRKSFLIEQASMAELWEVSYDPHAEPLYEGLVHDYRMKESIATPGFLGIRRIPLDTPMRVLALSPSGKHVILTPQSAEAVLSVVHLDIRRQIARIPLPASPGKAATVLRLETRDALAIPSTDGHQEHIIDMTTWQIVKRLDRLPCESHLATTAPAQLLDWPVHRPNPACVRPLQPTPN